MNTYILSGNLNGGDHLEDLIIDGTVKLIWILKKQSGR